jgi:peptidoglycan/LPS O-acetylase OafA/YrhL
MAVAGYHFTGAVGITGVLLLAQLGGANGGLIPNVIDRIGFTLIPGHAALMTFFVISGFVLRVSLGNGPQTMAPAATRFVIARVFRVYPILAVAVLLAALLANEVASAGQLAGNLLLLDVSLNSHLWALQVEMLMVPIILALYFLERLWGPWPVAGVALATTGLSFVSWWAFWPPLSVNLFAFAVGMIIPTLGRRFALTLSNRTATVWIVAGLVILCVTGASLGIYSRCTAVIEAYVGASLLSLVAYRLDLRVLKGLDARWLRRLGSAAGSYYVLHMATVPIGMALATTLLPASWDAAVRGAVATGLIGLWVLAIAPLMMAISQLIEMPGIALGRRLVRFLHLDGRKPAAGTSQRGQDRSDMLAGNGEVDLSVFQAGNGNADHVAMHVDHRAA